MENSNEKKHLRTKARMTQVAHQINIKGRNPPLTQRTQFRQKIVNEEILTSKPTSLRQNAYVSDLINSNLPAAADTRHLGFNNNRNRARNDDEYK